MGSFQGQQTCRAPNTHHACNAALMQPACACCAPAACYQRLWDGLHKMNACTTLAVPVCTFVLVSIRSCQAAMTGADSSPALGPLSAPQAAPAHSCTHTWMLYTVIVPVLQQPIQTRGSTTCVVACRKSRSMEHLQLCSVQICGARRSGVFLHLASSTCQRQCTVRLPQSMHQVHTRRLLLPGPPCYHIRHMVCASCNGDHIT
jgi:hypothetical protein